jgi:hypothetical protein
MSMSNDRIEFTLRSDDRQQDPTVRAAMKAFGMDRSEALKLIVSEGLVRCRPSQFGRFIVYRIQEGVSCNRVLELKPRIVPVPCERKFTDVSTRHAG